MRLVMMGTGPFAVPTFRALLDTSHDIAALVTQPARPSRGRQSAPENPLRALARERGTLIFDPETSNSDESRRQLAAYKPDLFVVADYGQILAAETLAVAALGGINLHGSLLPKYRGAAPINWAIYNGEEETGVTVIHMTPRVDAGQILLKASTRIDPDENAVELEERLAELGAGLVVRAIELVEAENIEPLPQDPSLATRARRLRKSDGQIDWSRRAIELKNQIRAMEPWPKTYTFWHKKSVREKSDIEPVRLILGRSRLSSNDTGQSDSRKSYTPGTVIKAEGEDLWISTGDGLLQILELQPAGHRLMGVAEFLRGHQVAVGDRFGSDDASA